MAYVPGTGSSAPSTLRVSGAGAWAGASVMVGSSGHIGWLRVFGGLTRLNAAV